MTTPAAVKACQPHPPTRPCPSNRPKKGPPGSIHQPSPLPLNNSEPLWLRRRLSPFRHDPPRRVLINSTGSPLTCLDPLYGASWPPCEKGTSSALLRQTSSEPVSKNLKTVSKRSSRYRTTYTHVPTGLKPMMTDAPLLPVSLTKMAIWCPPSGCDTSTMGVSLRMPWGPPSTRCCTLWTYTPNPPLTMKTSRSNQCPSGSALPYTPTMPTGKYYIKKLTKWRIGALLLKLSGIGTSIGSSTVWPRKSNSCKWTWKALGKLYAEHCQGLIGQGLRVTQQNIEAVRIMRQPAPVNNNNNNNKNNKGKGRAL